LDIILNLYFIFGQNVYYLTNGERRVGLAIHLVFYSARIKYLQNIMINTIRIKNVFKKNKIPNIVCIIKQVIDKFWIKYRCKIHQHFLNILFTIKIVHQIYYMATT